MLRHRLLKIGAVKRFTRSPLYARTRQRFPMPDWCSLDDRDRLPEAEKVLVEWPPEVRKPMVGVIQDYDPYPRWTKYCRFLENNGIPYEFFDLHGSDWIKSAENLDVVLGVISSARYHIEEMRKKYFVIEHYLGKICFPSFEHMLLYEDKTLEAFIAKVVGIPFARTHIFYRKADAMHAADTLRYPLVHKIDPGSGSLGVEGVRDRKQAHRVIAQVFSAKGRATHSLFFRQKNHVYFQDFVPNDGYDIRVMIGSNWAVGYYRRVPEGDFRASGMKTAQFGPLPEAAIRLAWQANQRIKSYPLVVDMLRGSDGEYHVIEFSPICQLDTPAAELQINGVPGVYILEDDGAIRFQPGRYWVHELSLRDFLLHAYLPAIRAKTPVAAGDAVAATQRGEQEV